MTETKGLAGFMAIVSRQQFVVLDTETTGLGDDAEICQIAIIDAWGRKLLDTFVKPVGPIPPDAARIHGITDAMVADAPGWAEVAPMVEAIIQDRDVIIYNADYDTRLMAQSSARAGCLTRWRQVADFRCAMLAFAEVFGEWSDYRQSYKWQTLSTAARFYRIPVIDAHTALGDCGMTLSVCYAMAGVQPE